MAYRAILLLAILGLSFSNDLSAQGNSYEHQIDALQKSFAGRSVDPLKQYLSKELTFLTYPSSATATILAQVFANMPQLVSLETVAWNPGKVRLSYTFSL